jgi:pSer/pThr/pTyr-binding forkhead associated (FHA) protein
MVMRAQLIPLDGGTPIEVVRDLSVVGRKDDCDLRIDHKSVSKLHCVLVKTDGLLLLRDLGSTNGTRVNGQRVRRAALMPNDQLAIAGFKFRVFLGPDEPAPPPASAAPVAEDQTQHLNVHEMADLLRKTPAAHAGDAASIAPLQPNLLPDVYPEADSQKSAN